MSQLFGTGSSEDRSSFRNRRSFENRLALSFRGDAKEQKKRRKKLQKKSGFFGGPGVVRKTAQDKVSSPSNVGSNVFKSNLGGTNR